MKQCATSNSHAFFLSWMYPQSFLCEKAKIKQHPLQRKNFVKSVRKQYGNSDSHAFSESMVYEFLIFSRL